MANETVTPAYQPEESLKNYQAERAHKDYQASIETGRASTQAAILINGGAATAILAFLSKQMPPPPGVVDGASVSLLLYALGVACGALSMWCSAYSSGFYGLYWQQQLTGVVEVAKAKPRAENWLSGHRWSIVFSFAFFVVASWWIAVAFIRHGFES